MVVAWDCSFPCTNSLPREESAMFDTQELREIGQFLQEGLPVVFANNGHSVMDGLLQMKVTDEQQITMEAVANVLGHFFKKRGLNLEYQPDHMSMMYLRSGKGSLKAGLSVTISNEMLVLFFS